MTFRLEYENKASFVCFFCFVFSSWFLTSCWKQVQVFHYMWWHLFRINLFCVWGRLPINQACISSLNSSRPFCSASKLKSIFFPFLHVQSRSRTDSPCHKALTWAEKQTGTSADSIETTWIKSSVSLSLSDQNYHSRVHAGARMSDTLRSETNRVSG